MMPVLLEVLSRSARHGDPTRPSSPELRAHGSADHGGSVHRGLRIAAVVDDKGHLVGVLTDGDLRRAFRFGFADIMVQEAMGKRPQVVSTDVLADKALAQMNDSQITCIFVTEGEVPIGLVHIHDLLRVGVA
jgi:arabinose-5-phosphate isomerase